MIGNLCATCLQAQYARFAEVFLEFLNGCLEPANQTSYKIVGIATGTDNSVGRSAGPTNFSLVLAD